MKTLRIYLTLLAMTTLAIGMTAQEYSARHDSVWVYNSWEAILDQWPDTLIVNPEISVWTPYDIEFETRSKATNEMLKHQTVAVAGGDTTWLVNTQWLKDQGYKGDIKKMEDYAPLFFNAKVAFIQCVPTRTSSGMALLGALLGDPELFSEDPWENPADFFWIDFDNKRVDKIDHKKLSELLSVYPDLQRRFEQMRDYKKRYIIQSFFIDFIKRAERDPSYPYIYDLLYPPQAVQ